MKDLSKQEVKNIIEGRRTTERIPNLCNFWVYSNAFGDREQEIIEWKNSQPYDIDVLYIRMPDVFRGTPKDPEYCWLPAGSVGQISGALDSSAYIEDWEDEAFVEKMFERFPSADSPSLFPKVELDRRKYIIGTWFFCLFERHWSLRGMQNALTDLYDYPDEVHRLYQKLTDFYMRVMERAKAEYDVDAIFTSDDIGTQNGPFFSLELFRTFFKPYYKQMIDKAHQLGMHFWLHTCGNIEAFLEDFIEIGLDVIHPIQKYTMDEEKIARKYGGRICILAGFDVQKIIPYGTPEEVAAEADHLIDTFWRPDGRFMITMGNGATPDWKPECLEALYREIAHHTPAGMAAARQCEPPDIQVFRQNHIRICFGGRTIHIDPFRAEAASRDADIIFITHDHYDHFSVDDIEKTAKKSAVLVVPEKMLKKAAGADRFVDRTVAVKPGEKYSVDGLEFETVPAYNIGKPFHPKSAGWVGYVLTLGDKRVYIAGDTDATAEAKTVKCDIALVPIGGTYTMNPRQAAELVNIIKPQLAIPVHYGELVGSVADGRKFEDTVEDPVKVEFKIRFRGE